MARIRYLKPGFFKDGDLARLPFEARLFYAGLWCYADKDGRLEDRPEELKIEIMPYDKIDANKILDLLAQHKQSNPRPFIQRYQVGGEKYIQILRWTKHQKPHHTEKASEIPPPPNLPPHPPTIKGMGKEKQLKASTELRNGAVTVKQPLKDVHEFLEYFNQKTGKKYILTSERKRIIITRLEQKHTLADLKKAVDNFVQDDWPERHKYVDVVYCIGVRNKVDNLEKWLEFRSKGPPGASKAIDRITNLDKAQRLLEAERTTTAMIRCFTELPEDDRKELLKWIRGRGSYLKPVYENAQKILKERTGRGKA